MPLPRYTLRILNLQGKKKNYNILLNLQFFSFKSNHKVKTAINFPSKITISTILSIPVTRGYNLSLLLTKVARKNIKQLAFYSNHKELFRNIL